MPDTSVVIVLLVNLIVLIVGAWVGITVRRLDGNLKAVWKKLDRLPKSFEDLRVRVTVLETKAGP